MALMSHAARGFSPLALLQAQTLTSSRNLERTGGGRAAGRQTSTCRFHDQVALDEIDLYAEVLSAVAIADRALTTDEIDEVLGLRQRAGAKARAC